MGIHKKQDGHQQKTAGNPDERAESTYEETDKGKQSPDNMTDPPLINVENVTLPVRAGTTRFI
jgi:hypothetical protein